MPINKDILNFNIKNIITRIFSIDKKICGFSKCKLLKINKDEIKGIPYICYTTDNHPVLMKIFPSDSDDSKDNSLIEIAYLSLFNDDILKTNVSPNIPYLYNYYLNVENNTKCLAHVPYKKIIQKIDKIKNYSNILFCEYYIEQDIDIWVDNNQEFLTETHWKSIIFQVIYTLAVLQDKYKFMHNDLHPGNILIDTVSPDTDLEYIFYGKYYNVRNLGYIAKLWDFEFSNIFNDEYPTYRNNIEFSIGYNQSYDIHNFLKGLLQIDSLPINTINFINSLYPPQLLYYKHNKVNTSYNTQFLHDGILTPLALEQFVLPIPKDLLDNSYFSEYHSKDIINMNKFTYP